MNYNLNSPLVCEGIVSDGCGGGRIFAVEDGCLVAYDPFSKQTMILERGIQQARKIVKNGCIVTVECEDGVLEFDLSKYK